MPTIPPTASLTEVIAIVTAITAFVSVTGTLAGLFITHKINTRRLKTEERNAATGEIQGLNSFQRNIVDRLEVVEEHKRLCDEALDECRNDRHWLGDVINFLKSKLEQVTGETFELPERPEIRIHSRPATA